MSRNARSIDDQIEFLPPNDAAFGGSGGADFVGFDGDDHDVFDDGPGSRWLPILASVVVLGLLSGGVIAAAPWDDGATATPPTTTPTSTTTAESPTTTERVLDIEAAGMPGFVLDHPGPMHLAGAWTIGSGERPPEAYADDRFDLWTTPGATRTSGRWMAVSTQHARGGYEETWPNGFRLAAGLGTGVIVATDDGVARMSFRASDETPFEIGGFGFDLADLLAVAAGVRSGADDNTIYYGSLIDSVLSGLTPGVSALVPYGGLGAFNLLAQPESGVYYIGDSYDMSLEVRVGHSTQVDGAVYDFLLQPVTDLGVADQAALDAMARRGRLVRVVKNPESPGSLLASWIDEDGAVTVVSNGISVSALVGLLPQARVTEPTEWADLIDRTNRGELNYEVPGFEPPVQTNVGQSGVGRDAPFWTIDMWSDPATLSVQTEQTGWGGLLGEISSAPQLRRYSSASITFLVGTAEWPNTARLMRVTLDGLPPVDVPMVQVGDSTIYAAGYAFTEFLPETVEFLDLEGNVITS